MKLKVAVVYNRTPENYDYEDDRFAEFDSEETIQGLADTLEKIGYSTCLIEADANIYDRLKKSDLDIVFNIAEGYSGENRESQVPMFLDMHGIPYTGSGPLTLALTLNKARSKEIIGFHGIATPRFNIFSDVTYIDHDLGFPLIVKPLHEGSSKGIRDNSIVFNQYELLDKIYFITENYNEPAIAEEYLEGREFTVGILGNENPNVLPVIEMDFDELPEGSNRIYSYEAKFIWDKPDSPLKILKCPAEINGNLYRKLIQMSLKTYTVLDCKDMSRIDLRLDSDGNPHVLEINPLPGLNPKKNATSCLPTAAYAAGMEYSELINSIISSAIKRYEL